MKIVYKCDYCNEYSADKQTMVNHEDKCEYNPKNKTCLSCKHMRNTVFTEYDECMVGYDFDIMEDVFDGIWKCGRWKEDTD